MRKYKIIRFLKKVFENLEEEELNYSGTTFYPGTPERPETTARTKFRVTTTEFVINISMNEDFAKAILRKEEELTDKPKAEQIMT